MEQQKEKQNPNDIRDKIKSFIRLRGPSLPIHVAKEIKLETLFTSAFLSELASTKDVKISNMKVGGSPLYFIPGQEEELERYSNYLPGKEKEAFLMLKEKKILKDIDLEPSIRVALRSIKDFAFPLIILLEGEKILYWRFHTMPDLQAKLLIEQELRQKHEQLKTEEKAKEQKEKEKAEEENKQKKEQVRIDEKKHKEDEQKRKSEEREKAETEKKRKEEEKKQISEQEKAKGLEEKVRKDAEKSEKQKIEKKTEKEKQLLELKPIKAKPVKIIEKSEFVNKIIAYLIAEDIEILEEKEIKKKEFECLIRINSDIGKIKFLCIAKDKKSITDNDLSLGMQKAQEIKMPLLIISNGSLNKKAIAYLEQYSSLIKFKRV